MLTINVRNLTNHGPQTIHLYNDDPNQGATPAATLTAIEPGSSASVPWMPNAPAWVARDTGSGIDSVTHFPRINGVDGAAREILVRGAFTFMLT